MDLNRFTEKLQEGLRTAQSLATRRGQQQLDVEHVLLALLEQEGGLAQSILLKAGVKLEDVHRVLAQQLDRLPRVSGPAAGPFGIPARNAAELLVEAINAGKLPAPYDAKGFGGAALDPIIIDENGSTTEVVQNYRDLVGRRGANLVVGYISSGSCLGIAPVADELKTLTVFFDCGTPAIHRKE